MIVVPSSLIANWEQEFQHWAPALKLVAYKGTADTRAALFASQVASFMQGQTVMMLMSTDSTILRL